MEIEILRHTFTDKSTIGDLYVDGEFECYTLEDCDREVKGSPIETWKVPGKTAIPRGKYEVIIDMSLRFQKTMPHILDVDGFTGVRIHCGNDDGDTEGCILVGKQKSRDWVGESRKAYSELYDLIRTALNDKERVEIIIGDKKHDV